MPCDCQITEYISSTCSLVACRPAHYAQRGQEASLLCGCLPVQQNMRLHLEPDNLLLKSLGRSPGSVSSQTHGSLQGKRGQVFDLIGHGCTEQQRLALARRQAQHLLDLRLIAWGELDTLLQLRSSVSAALVVSAAKGTNRCRESAARSLTSSVMVALNSSVWRMPGVSRSASLISTWQDDILIGLIFVRGCGGNLEPF